jgi:opacity protein-like surface antigen
MSKLKVFLALCFLMSVPVYAASPVPAAYISVKGASSISAPGLEFHNEATKKTSGQNIPSGLLLDGKAALGYSTPEFSGILRAELEFGAYPSVESSFRQNNEEHSLKIDNFSVMLNVYYDLLTGTNFTPYVGAGLGLNRRNVVENLEIANSYNAKLEDVQDILAYQLSVGLGYALSDFFTLDFSYRYVNLGSAQANLDLLDNQDVSVAQYRLTNTLGSSEIALGARYSF